LDLGAGGALGAKDADFAFPLKYKSCEGKEDSCNGHNDCDRPKNRGDGKSLIKNL
jgi:hypothetical protein